MSDRPDAQPPTTTRFSGPPGTTSDWKNLGIVAYRAARPLVFGHEDAMEVAQETMTALWVVRERPPDNVEAWVTRVAQYIATSEIRRRCREKAGIERLAALVLGQTANPEDIALARLTVQAWLDSLPQRERLAVELRYSIGLSRRAVADAMGVGDQTVKTFLRRATQKFHNEFDMSIGQRRTM